MGQRLVVSISNNKKLLANAYYHWSAYTNSTLHIAAQIISIYPECFARTTDDLELAVELLQSTGAGITKEEKALIKQKQLPELGHISLKPALDRTEGLLAITKEGMDENLCWAEGVLNINIETKTFSTDVFYHYSFDEYKEEYDAEPELPDFFATNPLDGDIPFSEIAECQRVVEAFPEGIICGGDTVIEWIQ